MRWRTAGLVVVLSMVAPAAWLPSALVLSASSASASPATVKCSAFWRGLMSIDGAGLRRRRRRWRWEGKPTHGDVAIKGSSCLSPSFIGRVQMPRLCVGECTISLELECFEHDYREVAFALLVRARSVRGLPLDFFFPSICDLQPIHLISSRPLTTRLSSVVRKIRWSRRRHNMPHHSETSWS